NTVLANLGPKIAVLFEIVGSVQSAVEDEVEVFGVNGALFERYIPVEVSIRIIVEFSTETSTINTRVFIDSRVIMGDVPEFYSGSEQGGPSISIPKEKAGNPEE